MGSPGTSSRAWRGGFAPCVGCCSGRVLAVGQSRAIAFPSAQSARRRPCERLWWWSAGGVLAIRCLVEVVRMAVRCYERRGAGVVSARRCEAERIGWMPRRAPRRGRRPWGQAHQGRGFHYMKERFCPIRAFLPSPVRDARLLREGSLGPVGLSAEVSRRRAGAAKHEA